MVRLSPDDDREIVRRFLEGESNTRIAAEFGCSRAAIQLRTAGRRSEARVQQYVEYATRLARVSPIEKGWVAGIIDGEGCITITGRTANTRSVAVVVSVSSTDDYMIPHLVTLCGGVSRRVTFHEPNRAAQNSWRLSSRWQCRAFCEWIADACVVKHRQAELVAEFCRSRMEHGYATEFTSTEDDIFQQIARLNRRKGPRRRLIQCRKN